MAPPFRCAARAALLVVAVLVLPAGAARADEPDLPLPSLEECRPGPLAKTFLPWLDPADYGLLPGGDFERHLRGWTLAGGAEVAGGDEPFAGGEHDKRALSLPAGSRVTTAPVCVGLGHPTLRFFARAEASAAGSSLQVEVLFHDTTGATRVLPIGAAVGAGGRWAPSAPLPVVANLLPLLPGEETAVAFRFTPSPGSSWQVDGVYMDPWKMR